MNYPRDRGRLANISRKVSPQSANTWHIPHHAPQSKGTRALYTLSAAVRSTRNEDGGIVLDIDRGQMFRLNPVGALILESVGKGYPETEIAKEVSRQYGISEET